MAFITQTKGENPLEGVDDGIYDAVVGGFAQTENRFKGQLYNPSKPEGPDNQKNNYEFQYEFTLDVSVEGEDVQTKVWANPTTGERSKLRKVVKALDAWETREEDGNVVEGFDDDAENIVGRPLRVLVQDGKIDNFLKAK